MVELGLSKKRKALVTSEHPPYERYQRDCCQTLAGISQTTILLRKVGSTIPKLADTTSTPQKYTIELREDVRITNLLVYVR